MPVMHSEQGACQSKKVLVALSGGVDSSVCVYLLQQQGYEVAGVVLQMSPAHGATVEDARRSAQALGIPLYVKDCTAAFEANVVQYFMDEYTHGRTPNPCIVCNPTVKFRALLETADEYAYPYVATGHYAKLTTVRGVTYLQQSDCIARDQSYMLYRLTQKELSRLIFPLSHLPKTEVRKIAQEIGLFCANKPDSQEICFIPDHDYAAYIQNRIGICVQGDFISPQGEPCGKHKGIIHYTVGQRKHLGIALGRPVYISEIDPVSNRIYLADAGDDFFQAARLENLSFTADAPAERFSAQCKIRSTAKPMDCEVEMREDGTWVTFAQPLRAVAKGQSIVLYQQETVIGGGMIDQVKSGK